MIRSGSRGWQSFLPLLLGIACSNEELPRPASRAGLPLRATVSAAFDIEPTPTSPAIVTTSTGAMACGSQRCLAAYSQSIGTLGEQAYATRIEAGPTLKDMARIPLPSLNYVWGVVARDDEFLVFGANSSAPSAVVYVRIRGADGAILPDVSERLPKPTFMYTGTGSAGVSRIAATNRSWLFVAQQPAGAFQLSLFDGDFQPIGTPVMLSVQSAPFDDVIPGDGQYLLIWSAGNAVRISEVDGSLLDASPIRFSRYDYTTGARGVYKDGIYQLAWPRYGSLWGSRIRASDGALLDPDDTVNAVSGAKLLCSNRVDDDVIDFDLAMDGTPVVAWTHSTGRYAAPVDVTLGTRPGNDTALPSSAWSPLTTRFEMHWLPGGGLLRESPDGISAVQGVALSQSPFQLKLGTKVGVVLSSPPRLEPATASNGSSFLVAFSTDGNIYASLLDERNGSYRGLPGLLGAGMTPAVDALGTDYLVAWLTEATLHLARVSNDGVVTRLPDAPVANVTYVDSASIRLTNDARFHLVTFEGVVRGRNELLAQRVAPDGSVLDAQPIVITSPSMLSNYKYRVVAATSLPASDKTFLVFAGTYGDQVQRFSSSTGSVLEPSTEYGERNSGFADPAVASDGAQVLVLYHDDFGTRRSLRGVFVDPVQGTAVPDTDVALFPLPQSVSASLAWHDGRSYSTVIAKGQFSTLVDFHLQRFNGNLEQLDGIVGDWGTPIASPSYKSPKAAVATNGSGRSIFVYQDNDPTRFGVVIKARFIDNDGLSNAGAAGQGSAGNASVGSAAGIGGHDSGGASIAVAGATSFSAGGTGTWSTLGPSTGGLCGGGAAGSATTSGGALASGGSSSGSPVTVNGGAETRSINAMGGTSDGMSSVGGARPAGSLAAGGGALAMDRGHETNVIGGTASSVGTSSPLVDPASGGAVNTASTGSFAHGGHAGGDLIRETGGNLVTLIKPNSDKLSAGGSVQGAGCDCRVPSNTRPVPGLPSVAFAAVWGVLRLRRKRR